MDDARCPTAGLARHKRVLGMAFTQHQPANIQHKYVCFINTENMIIAMTNKEQAAAY